MTVLYSGYTFSQPAKFSLSKRKNIIHFQFGNCHPHVVRSN